MKHLSLIRTITRLIVIILMVIVANRVFTFSQETDDIVIKHLRLIISAMWVIGAAIVTFFPIERE